MQKAITADNQHIRTQGARRKKRGNQSQSDSEAVVVGQVQNPYFATEEGKCYYDAVFEPLRQLHRKGSYRFYLEKSLASPEMKALSNWSTDGVMRLLKYFKEHKIGIENNPNIDYAGMDKIGQDRPIATKQNFISTFEKLKNELNNESDVQIFACMQIIACREFEHELKLLSIVKETHPFTMLCRDYYNTLDETAKKRFSTLESLRTAYSRWEKSLPSQVDSWEMPPTLIRQADIAEWESLLT